MPQPYPPVPEVLIPLHDIEFSAPWTAQELPPGGTNPELHPQSVRRTYFASNRSSFQKVRVEYNISYRSARWPCTPESSLPIGPDGI